MTKELAACGGCRWPQGFLSRHLSALPQSAATSGSFEGFENTGVQQGAAESSQGKEAFGVRPSETEARALQNASLQLENPEDKLQVHMCHQFFSLQDNAIVFKLLSSHFIFKTCNGLFRPSVPADPTPCWSYTSSCSPGGVNGWGGFPQVPDQNGVEEPTSASGPQPDNGDSSVKCHHGYRLGGGRG